MPADVAGRGLTDVVVIGDLFNVIWAKSRNLVAHLDPRIDRLVRKLWRGLRMPVT
jgi:hypothetical protein